MKSEGENQILAIDIGGSKLLSGIVSAVPGRIPSISGIIRRELVLPYGKDELFREIVSAADETLALSGVNPAGIGVTIPGLADPEKGVWLFSPFSGIRDFPIGEMLQLRYAKPLFAENDVNACAWAEHIFGVCTKVRDFLWITVSNGIGGGLVLGGKIFAGHFGCAAEIGHCKVRPGGARCGCGGYGCLEAESAGPGISRRYAALTGKNLSAEQIARQARAGESAAVEIYRETGRFLGQAAAMAANIVNPEVIVVGGGVAQSFDLFYPEMKRTFGEDAMMFANSKVRILKTGLGYEAGLFAAASLLYQKEESAAEAGGLPSA